MIRIYRLSISLTALLAIILLLAIKVKIDFTGDYEGIYLLKGEHGVWLEITDDLFPEEVDRLIGGRSISGLKKVESDARCTNKACASYEWNKKTGRGFIKTIYPDGRKLLICLSRFNDDDDKHSSGLFIGGNLPASDLDANIFDKNESGMAYFDGKRYYHIWCNVNEGIIDESNSLIEPARWKLIDSDVIGMSPTNLTFRSRHKVVVNGVPVSVERYLLYEVGNTFVTLVTTITNSGKAATAFSYLYGDEPWVGNYGTSAGDIGWLKDRLVTTETSIDTKYYNFAGIFDYGNTLAGEQHIYTNKANFIEWQHDKRPDYAFFSNDFGKIGKPEDKIPLSSHTNRVIGLLWGKRLMQPGQSFMFRIAVGMAYNDPTTGFPVKPFTGLN